MRTVLFCLVSALSCLCVGSVVAYESAVEDYAPVLPHGWAYAYARGSHDQTIRLKIRAEGGAQRFHSHPMRHLILI